MNEACVGFAFHRIHAHGWIQCGKECRQFGEFALARQASEGLQQVAGVDDKVGIQVPDSLEDLFFIGSDSTGLDIGDVEERERLVDSAGGNGDFAELEVAGLDVGGVDAQGEKGQGERQPDPRDVPAWRADGHPAHGTQNEDGREQKGVRVVGEANDPIRVEQAKEQQNEKGDVRAEKQGRHGDGPEPAPDVLPPVGQRWRSEADGSQGGRARCHYLFVSLGAKKFFSL